MKNRDPFADKLMDFLSVVGIIAILALLAQWLI